MSTTGRSAIPMRAAALLLTAGALLATPAARLGAQQPTTPPPRPTAADSARRMAAMRDTTRRDSAVTPQADPARGVDAELRVALYDLIGDRFVPALARLEWISKQPTTLATPAAASGALRGREDVLFLLAQGYWRLGMDQSFRQTAEQVVSGASAQRYGGILRAQLLLDAYRHGDYARALTMAQQLSNSPIRGLASLVAGLANYQQGHWAEARTSFATAAQAGAPYDQYAQYMDALAQLRGDTAQTAAALTSLERVAGAAQGEFAEQVRLTAAQLAYEAEHYDDAARLAGQIPATSGLGAEALLTRAWALYKANQADAAGQAFNQFATQYPQLPARDEARLMYAQVLLQQNHTADASRIFHMVADSARTEGSALGTRTGLAMGDAARALVAARAAGLLFITDPAAGKTVALADAAGSDVSVLAAAVNDSVKATPSVTTAPEIISLADVDARLAAVGPSVQAVPKRVMYVPTSATNNRVEYAGRAQALFDADAAVALARYRVQAALEAQQRQLAMLQALQLRIATDTSGLNATFRRLSAAQDSLARLATALDAAAGRLRQMFQAQVAATRMLADENQHLLDSLRTAMASSLSANDRELLDTEASTAQIYRTMAEQISGGIDQAVAHHPVFTMRDSVRAHGEKSRLALTDARNALASAQTAIDAAITELRGSDGAAAFRPALASAEAQRSAAESQLVAIVSKELDARATELIAGLKRDTEAAEFGSASASFFQALEAQGRTPNAPTGTTGDASGMTGTPAARSAPVATTSRPKQ